jgi:hypothetical protein
VKILRNVREAMSPGARVLVVEMLLVSGGPPTPAVFLDLNMLVMLGGKERTENEFGALFAKAGLRVASLTPTESPVTVIELHAA